MRPGTLDGYIKPDSKTLVSSTAFIAGRLSSS
jgi:hypothetical protein